MTTEKATHRFTEKTNIEIIQWIEENAERMYNRFNEIVGIEIINEIHFSQKSKKVTITYTVHDGYYSGNN